MAPYVETNEDDETNPLHYFKIEPGSGAYAGCFRLKNYQSECYLISRTSPEPHVYNCWPSDPVADEQYFKFDFDALVNNLTPSDSIEDIGKWQASPIVLKAVSVNQLTKTLVTTGLGMIPEIGGLLATLTGLLWPDDEANNLNQIDAGVREIVKGVLEEKAVADLRRKTEGLKEFIRRYGQSSVGISQKGQQLTYLLGEFTIIKRDYLDNETPWQTLQYFVPMATLHLALLRDQLFLWDEIYPEARDQGKDTEVHRAELQRHIKQYTTAAQKIFARCIKWRMEERIKDEESVDVEPMRRKEIRFRNVYDFERGVHKRSETNTHPGSPWAPPPPRSRENLQLDRFYENLRDSADSIYRQQIKDLLAPSLQWPQFINRNKEPITREIICNTTEPMGEVVAADMKHFNDRELAEQHGQITRISLFAWDRVNGFEIWYGDTSSGFRGNKDGTERILHVGEDEAVVCVSGNIDSRGLNSLQFWINQDKKICGGGGGGFGNPKISDNFRLGQPYNGKSGTATAPSTPRLRYVYGWSCDSSSTINIPEISELLGVATGVIGFGASLAKTEEL
ncbi:hypothetical protein MW887_004537 [Aspergillus wentii]|nr:hypothetical protein MW887_004537 [Aspergillus wentii]